MRTTFAKLSSTCTPIREAQPGSSKLLGTLAVLRSMRRGVTGFAQEQGKGQATVTEKRRDNGRKSRCKIGELARNPQYSDHAYKGARQSGLGEAWGSGRGNVQLVRGRRAYAVLAKHPHRHACSDRKLVVRANGIRIIWLYGKAGTGKSTIFHTVAQTLDDAGLLGASFFSTRGRAGRSHGKLLFATIASQLAIFWPDIRHAIAAALDDEPLLCEKYLTVQFEKLLLQPLQSASRASTPPTGVVVVIDALDECDSAESIRTTLLLLSRIEAVTSIRSRIFMFSRPEPPVELGFRTMSGDLHVDVRLEEAQVMFIAHDIQIFYGTGTAQDALSPQKTPVRPTFKDGFIPRLCRSFLTSLEGKLTWRHLLNHLEKDAEHRYFRLNVQFGGQEPRLDDIAEINKLSQDVNLDKY
ncbi:hypothetical protein LTR33_003426 [Friedmanniomyces endolithicus]|nr:hypothetical protein LTR33_003426 [Friedmanniomyces endolithicus]